MPIPSYILPSAPAYTEDSVYALIPTPSTPIYTPDAISFTRGSDATRTASNGLIQRVPWNLASWSEDFSNVLWGKFASSITANSTNAPNGTLTADTLVGSGTSASHYVWNAASLSTNSTFTFSIYAKKNTNNFLQITGGTSPFGSNFFANFDLNNGVLGTIGSSTTATITNVGDGWFRCTATGTTVNSSVADAFSVFALITSATSARLETNTLSTSIFIWGAQINEGSSAQTYFPTTDRLNVPRIDFSQGSCPTLLLEPQRTNLALYSDQFDTASWLKANITVAANSTISPDGTTSADTINIQTIGTATIRQNITVTENTTYTFSFYALRGTATDLRYSVFNFSGSSDIVSSTSYYAQTNSTTWSRITVTFTTPTGCTLIGIYPTRDATSTGTFFVWGAQLELGAYATTYIPTTSTSVTRLGDSCFKIGISSLIGQSEGVVYLDTYFTQQTSAGFRTFFSLEGSITNQFSGINPQTTNNGNDISYAGTNYTLTTGRHKIVCTYSQANNQRKLFVDGVLRGTSTHTNFLATVDRVSIGGRINPYSAFDIDRPLSTGSGIIAFALYNTLLTDAQCINLTT